MITLEETKKKLRETFKVERKKTFLENIPKQQNLPNYQITKGENKKDMSELSLGQNELNEDQIKKAVRDAVASLPQSKLDQIINEELTKIIQERLNSSKIIISTENKKN